MEKWEEAGFGSEEAYNEYQQTIKEKSELKEELEKLKKQVGEKQNLIDEHRTKISGLSEELKALKDEVEISRENEADKKEVKEMPNEVDLEKENEKRISTLSEEQLTQLNKEYEEANPEQKELLSTPEGMKAFLDLKLDTPAASSPFVRKKNSQQKSIEEQVKEAFGKVVNNTPPAPNRTKTGFVDRPPRSEKVDEKAEQIRKSRQTLLSM